MSLNENGKQINTILIHSHPKSTQLKLGVLLQKQYNIHTILNLSLHNVPPVIVNTNDCLYLRPEYLAHQLTVVT